MPDPVNLNRFRKQKARAAKKARADENAVTHGRSKAEKSLDQARRDKADKHLSEHRRDDKPDA